MSRIIVGACKRRDMLPIPAGPVGGLRRLTIKYPFAVLPSSMRARNCTLFGTAFVGRNRPFLSTVNNFRRIATSTDNKAGEGALNQSNSQPGATRADVWEWVPPTGNQSQELKQSRASTSAVDKSYTIPTLKGKLLEPEEVKLFLDAQGAENVIVLPLKSPLADITTFVIATGRSRKHMRKMSEAIFIAVKNREVPGVKPGMAKEGDKDDDWQVVDCRSFLVHIMLADTRAALDIESHWSANQRPSVPYSKSEIIYEENFMSLLEKYPIPDSYAKKYGPFDKEDDDDKEIKTF